MESCNLLVTGGSGYIGSHCVIALAEAGHKVIAMENSKTDQNFAFQQIEKILGRKIQTCSCDLLDLDQVNSVFEKYEITTVIHLAATKGISDSINSPVTCYRNNLMSTLNILEAMKKFGVKKLIFSSSCAVYGHQKELPVKESAIPSSIGNVYGKSKYFVEEILRDAATADKDFKFTILRYFNPVGAHPSGLLGEDPKRNQINFLTLLAQSALSGKTLTVFGSSNIRDFVHVMDVAEIHCKALESFNSNENLKTYNVGTGVGNSLLKLITTFEEVNNVKVNYMIKERREGEIEAIVADTTKAKNVLKWNSTRLLEDMCRETWKWTKYYSECIQKN